MATLLSGLGNDERRKRLKLQPLINLSPYPNSHYAIATLLSGLGNDGRRKRLKLRPQSFNPPQPKAARPLPILHRVLVLPKKSFNEFIRHQVQALTFASFC